MDIQAFYKDICKVIPSNRVKMNELMKHHTSFRIGGPADIMVLPQSSEEIKKALMLCRQKDIPVFIMGNGTNLLVRDKGIRGVVIKIAQNFNDVEVKGNTIRSKAGVFLSVVARIALENHLSGLEFAAGIPGTVGGAIIMNAGAYGGEMADVIKEVVVMDFNGEIFSMKKEELEFGYRWCNLQKGGKIVLEAELELKPGNYEDIKLKMEELSAKRRMKQPLNMPSAGSAFKRPTGNYAGALIEKAGLKGFKVGGAMISDLHAGFIVNTGNATAEDVLKLIGIIQRKVKEEFGILLEPEIKVVGEE
ncbi:UDP-N-acetylmuramate dehydrogenase [Thermosediminibacter oceani]|uniref:UDP-N-acetylenolpyruvoylglucosamine reductase n=1 Tax=Thermosediminibacter oceani (strain ATCC BAA-1034 / DSM 16646 / JW/IW-1228P) TaxID=555079 RepID=D9S2I6_THEOJ|nr:UDP-N-acetylmuramate dehydrogenase [Thermosediminibacter oceani]ADL07613.1 UDP-N-acetylmuramate dehydrogenase [Thermosediminibacter oceani DSM 16646]